MEKETQDRDVERQEEEKQRESVIAPRYDSPPSTIMNLISAELEQRELRLVKKVMVNLEENISKRQIMRKCFLKG